MKWFCTFLTRDFAANVPHCYCTIWFSSFSFSVLKMHFSWKFHINYYLCTLTLRHIFNSSQKIVMKRLDIFVVVLVFWNWDTFDKSYFYGKLKTHFLPYSTGAVTIVLFLHGSFGEKSLSFSKKRSAERCSSGHHNKAVLVSAFCSTFKAEKQQNKTNKRCHGHSLTGTTSAAESRVSRGSVSKTNIR